MWSRMIRGTCSIALLFLCCRCAVSDEPTLADFYVGTATSTPERVATLPAKASAAADSNAKPLGAKPSTTTDNYGCDGEPDECCNLLPSSKMCPCTYTWAEGLLMWRDNQSTNRPVVINLNTQDTLIGAGDLNFDAGWGIRAGFGIHRCDDLGWEFEYLGLFDQSAGRSVELADELALPGDLGLSTNNFFFADEVSVHYSSQVNSAEVNRVCCCCCCDGPCSCQWVEWLYGFRYLNLHEDLSIVSTDLQEGTSHYDVDTNNNLFGVQVGSRARRSRGRWSWEGTGKAGIFGNAAEQHSDPIVDFPAFVVRPGRSESAGNVAFVGDLNLTAIYQLNAVWGVRLGYNLIWIEGVALAPDQLDFANTTTSGSGIDTDGGVLLHGVSAGLEARW
jgi:hypothetical protein